MKAYIWIFVIVLLAVENVYTNGQDISIVPLEKPVLAGQAFLFSVQENNTGELKIKWDMGDGTTATGNSVKHIYRFPGIYTVSVYIDKESGSVKQSSLIIRVHTPETLNLPQVFLDTDARCEADDQHYIAYTLYSGLDILGINSIHNDQAGSEAINYGEILYIMKLMNNSGKPWDSMPAERIFHGAVEKLTPPASGVWSDTRPIVTEGSEAILSAARGASPENPLLVLPVGPCTNIASAVLQAREEGFELRDRIRVIWLGGVEKDYYNEYNGRNDPWSVYVMGQSGVDLHILLAHPTSLKLNVDKRVESGLYPENDLGKYLKFITPVFQWGSTTILKSIHDVCVPAMVISNYKGFNWVTKVAPVKVSGPENDYQWQEADSTSTVHLIWDIDGEAMKSDLFNTLNGHPTNLIKKKSMSADWEQMHQSKEKVLQDFNEAKFGMFIHWGAYSRPAGVWKGERIPGLGEWIMHNAPIPREEYKEMCSRFNPVKFNAEEWVQAAKMAGMRYIVAMPKHHDGFAMYDSKVTEYDIMDATHFGRDPMDELYRACQKYGVRFSIYYSHATDWMDGGDAGVADFLKTHPEEKQVWPSNTWDPAPISFTEYIDNKSKPQMRELLQKFPWMQEIWYDVPRLMTREQSFEFYKLAYNIQPSCLINSRVGNGMGDFWIPGDNKIPADGEAKGLYWETPGTLNNTWGYKSYDVDWKSTKELLYWITEITSKGGNYLLNVGPTAEGVFPEESMAQLKVIGDWMGVNGESVYGTKKWFVSHEGPTNLSMNGTGDREKHGFDVNFTHEDFWFSAKDNFLYVTSLKWPDNKRVFIKSLSLLQEDKGIEVKSIKMLGCNQKVIWEKKKGGIEVLLPSCTPNVNGYVLKLEL